MAAHRVAPIDGLRAIAMTMVIAQHCGLLPFGWLGVWLFYAISGYVITRALTRERVDDTPRARIVASFIVRRVGRILPTYFLYVGIVGVVFALAGGSIARDLPYLATFTFNWQMIFGFSPRSGAPAIDHLWTISVEQQFYLFFPWLLLYLGRRTFVTVSVAAVALMPLARVAYVAAVASALPGPAERAFAVYASSALQFDSFLLGALIALYGAALLASPGRRRAALAGAGGLGALYAAAFVTVNATRRDTRGVSTLKNVISGVLYGEHREAILYSVVAAGAAAIVAATVTAQPGPGLLSGRAVTYVGRVSYSGYLFHALVIHAVAGPLLGALGRAGVPVPMARGMLFAVVLPVTLAVATMSYRWCEIPCQQISTRLSDAVRSPRQGRAMATAAVGGGAVVGGAGGGGATVAPSASAPR